MSMLVPIMLIFLLGDYSGTLEPHVSFNLNNDESLSFLGFMSIFKNSVLLFLLFNMMPDTQSESTTFHGKMLYSIYTLLMPIVVALGILIPTTLASKQLQSKYQTMVEQLDQFDIALFLMSPIFAYLVAESLYCSGYNTLIIVGIF